MLALLLLLLALLGWGSTPDPQPAPALDVKISVRLTHMGSRTEPSLPLPGLIACSRSIPATCTKEVECHREAGSVVSWARYDCAYIDQAIERLFNEPDSGAACTEIYGGPERAHITGEVNGRHVDMRITRTDGCQIALWDLHAPIWSGETEQVPERTSGVAA
jgi:hypothetical protein